MKSKNKSTNKNSGHVAEFFRAFLRDKKNFVAPVADGCYAPYYVAGDNHGKWPEKSWIGDAPKTFELGVIDFRFIPGVLAKMKDTMTNPYFQIVMQSLLKKGKPLLEVILNWLLIYDDITKQTLALAFVQSHEHLSKYKSQMANYYPGKFEHMGDMESAKPSHMRKCY